MNSVYSRRDFIKQVGAGTIGISMISLMGGCESLLQAIRNRPVRRIINSLTLSDPVVQTYQDAVTHMKSLPSSDPRNWTRQAEIHLNHCPHGNWFFLPWHRAYLFYFEQICRELTGDETFALPYWNWTMERAIPTVFWGSGNSLFNNTRAASQTSQASLSMVGQSVMESIFDETDFELFGSFKSSAPRGGTGGGYGALEATPHNYIHGFVGGDMGAFMSPLDPVFWTHHNMIDCCWAHWNIDRENPNTNDSSWTNFTFTDNFVDRNGNSVDVGVITTVLMPLLSYRFEDSRKGDDAPRFDIADARRIKRLLERGTPIRLVPYRRYPLRRGIEVTVDEPVSVEIEVDQEALQTFLTRDQEDKLLLRLDGVDQPPQEDFFVRVFVNSPEVTTETPIDDPQYAGSFAFFVDEQHDEHVSELFIVDLTDTIRRSHREGRLELDQVTIQLVAVPMEDRTLRTRSFTLESLELHISRFSQRGDEPIR